MSLDIKKSCSFQILISLTTVVWPGYCRLKSEVAALNLCWCCHVVFWSDAPPSTNLPIMESVVLRHLGCQLYLAQLQIIGNVWIRPTARKKHGWVSRVPHFCSQQRNRTTCIFCWVNEGWV